MGKLKGNRRLDGGRREDAGRGDKRSPRSGMRRDILAVVLLALAAVGALALATFSALDGALIARDLPAANLCGPLGHRAARALYGLLGYSALVLPMALATVSVRLFQGAPPRITVLGALAYVILTLAVASLAHLALGGRSALPFPAGGAVGAALSAFSVRFLSTWGSAIVLVAVAEVASVT